MSTGARPLIGITTSADTLSIDGDPLDIAYVPTVYDDAVRRAGGTPVHVPPLPAALAVELLARLDGILLSGGGDVDPRAYGAVPSGHARELDGARDTAEQALACAALERTTPLLGICRGAQILNVALGGTLHQDLPAAGLADHHFQSVPAAGPTHAVALAPGSRLEAIYRAPRIEVNSVHHQGVDVPATGLTVSARSDDGIVEGLETRQPGAWVVAVQWHPEAMQAVDPVQQRLFAAFVAEARIHAKRRGR